MIHYLSVSVKQRFVAVAAFLLLVAPLWAASHSYSPVTLSALVADFAQQGNAKFQPGDTIFMEDGVYHDFQLTLRAKGSEQHPIVLRARNYGKVYCEGLQKLLIGGEWLVVDGLCFRNGYAASNDIIQFRYNSSTFASNCRLTNTVIDNCNNPALDKNVEKPAERWVMLYGRNNRVDHCYFANKDRSGVLLMVDLSNVASRESHHRIDHNFFGYREMFPAGNGGEIVRIGVSANSQEKAQAVVEDNFFYQCNGEPEVVSIKSCENIIRRNTFYESQGSVVCRHGHRNVIESNVFIGNKVKNTGGVRIINEGQEVYNNYFQELAGTGSRSALCIQMGYTKAPSDPLSGYHQVKKAQVAFNTFVNCASIEFGTSSSYGGAASTLPPVESSVCNNIIYNPTLATPLKEISGVDLSGIHYEGNIMVISPSATWLHKGFVPRSLEYQKQANGLYQLMDVGTGGNCPVPMGSEGVFDYVQADITGQARTTIKDAGCVQYEHRNAVVVAPRASEVGLGWYDYSKPNY